MWPFEKCGLECGSAAAARGNQRQQGESEVIKPSRVCCVSSEVKRWPGVVLAVAALSGCQSQAPLSGQAQPAPELSYLNIAISIPLEPLEKAADTEMPRSGGIEPFQYRLDGGAEPPACWVDVGYSIARGPLAMSGSSDVITTSVELSYSLKGRKQMPCPGPAVTGSCGTDGEPLRTASVSIDTAVTILPSLATSVRSSLGRVVPGNRCVLHPLELDITDSLMTGFDATLTRMLPTLDKRLAAGLDLRRRAAAGWARMSEPAELRPNLWLALNPEGIGVVPVTVAGGELRTGLQVRLRPVVTAGAKPKADPKPMPQADIAQPADSFKLRIPADIEQSFVQARLNQALDIGQGGTTLSMSGYNVRVTAADIYGQGSQVLIKLTFTGDLSGTAYLTGTPYYDPNTRMLGFPDLDYTLDTKQALLKGTNWLAHDDIRDRLRGRFTVDMGPPIERMTQALEAALNRRRGSVQLHGTVQDLSLLGIFRLENGDMFTAYLAATGKISADIDVQ